MQFASLRRPIYPALLALYPALFVFGRNRAQVQPAELWLPLALELSCALAVWWLATRLLGDRVRAALFTAVFVVVGHAFGWITLASSGEPATDLRFHLGMLRLAVWVVIAGILSFALVVWSRDRHETLVRMVPSLNVAALVLLAFALAGLARGPESVTAESGATPGAATRERPDIYYLVLDGYGGNRVLREIYGHDDRPFLEALEARGFYVARDSHANYLRTLQSLASSLGMTYLGLTPDQRRRYVASGFQLFPSIRDNEVMSRLAAHGYRIHHFESGYNATDLWDRPGYVSRGAGRSEFENTLLEMTPLSVLLPLLGAPDPFELHRRRIRFTLEELPSLAAKPGPKFVFAHIVAPHPPFVFAADGAPVENRLPFKYYDGSHYLTRQSRSEYLSGYRAQAAFIAEAVLSSIDGVLAASPSPPVILLQGDHGPGVGFDHDALERSDLVERGFILNAYRLSDEAAMAKLYPTITPVNSFRLVLGHFLGEELPLLEDRSYYNAEARPFDFVEITDVLRNEIAARAAERGRE